MEYENRIVCFFDILGFASTVCEKILDADTIAKMFAEIQEIIAEHSQDQTQASYFSDSFVISIRHTTASPSQLSFVVAILVKLLHYKLVARGAIVYGELVHTKDYIYGPALVNAANLEKTIAIYPRIILDKSLDALTIPTIGNASITYTRFFNGFLYINQDPEDELYYIDFINYLKGKEIFQTIKQNLEEVIASGLKNNREKVREKYTWLQKKLNDATETVEK